MDAVEETVVMYNTIQENGHFGITLFFSNYNLLHHNNLIDNNITYTSQAYDGQENNWYDTEKLEGNYWSDYNGTGNYNIDGGAVDPYPLSTPATYIPPQTTIPTSGTQNANISLTYTSLASCLIITLIILRKKKRELTSY
jgi:parallel beta-helix repeat protein